MTTLMLTACDDDSDEDLLPGLAPVQADQTAPAAAEAATRPTSIDALGTGGSGDLSVLGGDANLNQAAFRQKYGLGDPTQEQISQWDQYDARLTAYSNRDLDWQYPTTASANWMGTTWNNGDPLAVEGTTVAVDFNRIPRGSLIYIPALNMYAEANDTGATGLWASSDAGQTDYDSSGAGRVDVYNLAGDRTPVQVEHDFQNQVGSREYGQIYIVYRGSGWKNGEK